MSYLQGLIRYRDQKIIGICIIHQHNSNEINYRINIHL